MAGIPTNARDDTTGSRDPLMLQRTDFAHPAVDLARDLIGVTLMVGDAGGLIVETEAYDRTDPASHTFSGPTVRNAVMFGPAGHAYVYRSYGLHWCLNLVGGIEPGQGEAVLIRALEPTTGLAIMRERRGTERAELLCSGPGRLTQALGITGTHNGLPLDAPPFRLEPRQNPVPILAGPRIGISKGVDTPWRFGLAGSRALSRPFRSA